MIRQKVPRTFCLFLLLAGCSHTPSADEVPPPKFALEFMAGRQGEIEPCGCHARPLGGVDRELNARTALRKDETPHWSLASGPQFLPLVPPPSTSYALRKASYLLDAWNTLGIDVASPDAHDFALGIPTFQKWVRGARTQWVSTNLYAAGRPLFPAFTAHVFGAHTVQFFGASGCQKAVAPTVECREPIKALKAAIEKAPPRATVVALTSFDDETLERALKELPRVAVFLNSPGEIALPGVVEEPDHRWLASPTPRGRALVRLEVTDGDVAHATNQTVWIDREYDEPANPLRTLLEKWKATQHDAEVGSR